METSRALIGSSATIRSGLSASARAIPIRCRWPPLNSCGIPVRRERRDAHDVRAARATRSAAPPAIPMPWMSSGSPTIAPTVIRGLRLEYGSWKIIWKRCRSRRSCSPLSVAISWPSNRTDPTSGRAAGRSPGRSVVLPRPGFADQARGSRPRADGQAHPVHRLDDSRSDRQPNRPPDAEVNSRSVTSSRAHAAPRRLGVSRRPWRPSSPSPRARRDQRGSDPANDGARAARRDEARRATGQPGARLLGRGRVVAGRRGGVAPGPVVITDAVRARQPPAAGCPSSTSAAARRSAARTDSPRAAGSAPVATPRSGELRRLVRVDPRDRVAAGRPCTGGAVGRTARRWSPSRR